jgi:hypothetical protein
MKTRNLVAASLCLASGLATGCGGSTESGPVPVAIQVVQAPPATISNGEALAPLQVLIVDASGAAVNRSGVGVALALAGASGSIGGSPTAVTDGTGRATFTGISIVGPVGTYNLVFSSAGLTQATSSSVRLTTGRAASIQAASPTTQSAPEVSPVPSMPTVRVTDSGGNPVPGTPVEFVATRGTGGIVGALATSDSEGLARLGSWTLGDAGPHDVEARAAGLGGSPVVFRATAAPTPVALAMLTAPPPTATVRTVLTTTPTVQLLNARGNPTALTDLMVTVGISGGEGGLAGTVTRSPDTRGQVSFPGLSFTGLAVGSRGLVFAATGITSAISSSIQVGPGPASQVSASGPTSQTAQAYSAGSSPPAVVVRDADGNGVPGESVTFSVTSGGGTIAGSPATSGPDGIARATSWILGAPGPQTAEGRVTGLAGSPVAFTATALVPPPTALRVSVEPQYSATVGVAMSTSPAVQVVDAQGRSAPQAGITVTVAMTGGNGSLLGQTTQVSDATGRVAFPSLTFSGLAAGVRGLTFMSPGLTSATSRTIQVSPGSATQIEAASVVNQSGIAYRPVSSPPAVRVRDAQGNPVPGIGLAFVVAAGGGFPTGGAATTGADGVARVGSWTLGAPGAQELRVTANGLTGSPVVFTATARATDTSYSITLRFLVEPSASQRQAFEDARARIEEVVVGDVPDLAVNYPAMSNCGNTALNETVDDLLIFVQVGPIDGPGSILGRAGPCLVRSTSRIPVVGFMQFDSDDLAVLEAQGTLRAVVLHEMMHVLGFGSMWQDSGVALLVGASTVDPYFIGAGARSAFADYNGGSLYPGNPVPVENTGGTGTVNSHWRESVLASELMTGWVVIGGVAPMSRTTIASMGDLGYSVDLARADPFDLSSALRLAAEPAGVRIVDDVVQLPLHEVDEVSGEVRPIR